MTNVVLGGSIIDGFLDSDEDLPDLIVKDGRMLQGFSEDRQVTFWWVEAELREGGVMLASGNYANPVQPK